MKNLKVLFTVLCVACACLNTTDILAAISGTWTETAFSDIPNGATIIIASNTDKALPSGATTASPTQVAITITGTAGNLTIVPTDKTLDDLVWTIDNSMSSAVKFITYGTTNCYLRLSSTSSNTALRVATTNSNNTFTMGSNGKLLKLSTANRYVGIYSSGSDWRTYNSESAANYGSTSLKFYVLNSGSSGSTETTVSFDPNTGSGSIDAMTGAANETITLPDGSTFTNSGYTFIGWNTAKDGSGTFYAPATEFTIPASDITLYAVWGFTIIWSLGGDEYAEGNPTTSVKSGERVTTLPTPPDGNAIGSCANTFMGWSTHNLGSETGQGDPGDLFTTIEGSPVITRNTIFYAVFATGTAN